MPDRDGVGLQIRRSFRLGRSNRVNLSRSGFSLSKRAGRLSLNSRGRGSIRLGKGIRWTFKL
jgi:hypothetical protein